MNKETLVKLKEKLLEERGLVEEELSSLGHKNPDLEGDWTTNFPSFGDERTEQDENADEVEEYENELPMEYALETRLQNINLALEKIEDGEGGTYGICESCGEKIEDERLEIEPSAKTHVHCK